MKMKREITWLMLLMISAALLAACSTQQAPSATQDTGVDYERVSNPEAEPTITEAATDASPTVALEEPTETPPAITEPAAVAETQEDGYPAPGYQFPTQESGEAGEPYPSPEQVEPPPLKLELEATDPAAVNLAAGNPTLLEFFAFW